MNYRGKHKKFQTGGPKIDPKVVEQMNKYMSGNNGDIQSRFALDTRVAIANDPVKIKERKKENTKKNYQNLRRVPNLKLYGDKELQMLADKPKDQWPEHVRNSLDNLESDEQRVMMHPDFDRNRPVSEQMELNRDNSLRTRVLRGRNTFMNSSGIPIVSDIAKMVAAPGSSFANLTMDAENQYVKPGVKQGLFNLGIDLLNVAPTETVGLANKSINTVKEVINKSTENGILSNAHKLNPFAFKPNSEMMYRGIGKEGMEDALESGVFRAKQNVAPIMDETGRFDMSKQFQGTYYSPKFNTADQYGAGYIAEVPKDVTDFRLRYKGKGNKTWSQIADENIPIDKGKILKKDWLQGYKQVEVPKTTQNFKSEIDWGAWNSEIPSNQALMQEYNAIEQTTKANGSWMKNPDGSVFQGTPEQFVQQNSQNFKKAFPNPIKDEVGNIQINYHGQRVGKPFNVFKQSERGNHGKGNYTFAGNRKRALKFANDDEKRLYELYINSNNPQETIPSVFDESFNSISGRLQPEFDYLKVGKEQVTPQSNYLKSAVGNNGMFDMSNPNIYKALVPATVGAGILSQQEKPKKGFKEGGETMNYRGKKCMECGGNPKMQTAGEMQCPQGYTSDGYGNCIPDEPKKFNMYTVPEQTPDEMAALSKFGDWWKRGRPNQLKNAGNEGTDANPMGRGPVDTGPEKTPEKPKINPFLLMRGVSTGASLIGNMVARKAQNSYEYNQMTALGQMNPIDSDQFQPTYNNMYAEQGGMVNPFSTYSKYGGNLKKIFSQFKQNQEYSNKAQMDMGDGKLDDQGMMEKGGIYDLPNQYGYDIVRKLLRMGRMGHQNYIKGTKPMHGKMQGGGESPPDFSDPRYRGTNPNNYTSKEDRLKARDLLISNIEKDIANGIKYEHANPELIAKGACAFGACTEYEKVGLLKDIYSGNPLFEQNARQNGFGWPNQDYKNFQPGDAQQHFLELDEKTGNPRVSHMQIFLGKTKDGKYRFYDNYRAKDGVPYSGERSYTDEEMQQFYINNLSPRSYGAAHRVPIVQMDKAPILDPKAKKAIDDRARTAQYNMSAEAEPNYSYSSTPDAKKSPALEKVIKFGNNSTANFNMIKSLSDLKLDEYGSPKEIHEALLRVYGELMQENKGRMAPITGVSPRTAAENAFERVFKPKNKSVGPGQIKFNTIDEDLKKEFGINKPKDLYNWDKVIPLMVAKHIKTRQWMDRQGTDFSARLVGEEGVDVNSTKWSDDDLASYFYRGLGPKNIKKQLHKEIDAIIKTLNVPTDKQEEFRKTYYADNIRSRQKVMDEGSYADKVKKAWQRDIVRVDNSTEDLESEKDAKVLQEAIITSKVKKKMRGGYMKKGGLTPNKAREILHDGTAQGHPLTDKQRRFFGAMSKGNTIKYRSHKK